MSNPTAPADAGASSNAGTPVADATLANVPSGQSAGTPMGGPRAAVAAGKMNEDGTLEIGPDGEPTPIGNEAQQKIAQTIAASFKKTEDGQPIVPSVDLNQEIKNIAIKNQTQSTPGPTPAELKPVEQPAMNGADVPANNVAVQPAQVKAKGAVTPPQA